MPEPSGEVTPADGDLANRDPGDVVAALTAPMLALDLWVSAAQATEAATRDPSAVARLLPAHLRRMIQLEEDGVLFASGPFLDDDGQMAGDGMTILRAASREQAEAIVAGDPLVQAGLRTVAVRRWRIMEGGLRLHIGFASGRYEMS